MTSMVLSAASATAATKVYLLAGQSNMDGAAPASGLYAPYNQPQPDVQIWYSRNTGSPSTWKWDDLDSGFGHHYYNCIGPEVSFGYAMNEASPGDDIYLIKYGWGGTNLANHWKPDGTGVKYNQFKAIADAALLNLTTAGRSPTIAGMIWMQGESDPIDHPSYAPAYENNLRNFITKVRSDFATPDMPFVIGRITSYFGVPYNCVEGTEMVRDAQVKVGEEMSNAAWIDTDDPSWGGTSTGHYNTYGQIELGKSFAVAMNEIPEPGTLAMLAAAAISLLAYVWRKHK